MSGPASTAEKGAFAAGCAALLLVPLVLLPGGYQFANLPKLLTLQVTALTLTVCLLARRAAGGPLEAPALPVFLFAAASFLQLSRSLNPYEAAIPVFVLTGSATVGFGLTATLDDRRRLTAVRVLAGTAGVVCLVGTLESWGVSWAQVRSAGRPSATLGFRNTAATYAIGCLPWCVYLLTRKGRIDRTVGALSTGLGLLFVLYTRSRGAWLGLALTAVAAGVWWVRHREQLPWRLDTRGLSRLAVAAAAVTVVFYVGSWQPRFEDASPSRLDEKKQSVGETVRSLTTPGGDRDRLVIWSHTADLVRDHALLGVGAGNWSALYPRYDRGDILHIRSSPRRPHNDYLWVASELGVPGLLLLLWCLAGVIWKAFGTCDAARAAAACSVVAIAVHSGFSFPREQAAPSLILWFGVAYVWSGDSRTASTQSSGIWAVLGAAAIAGCVVGVWAIRSDAHYASALIAQRAERAGEQAAEAAASLLEGAFDHRAYLVLGDAQFVLREYEAAAATYRRYARVQPNLAAVRNNLGRALNAAGEYEAAERELKIGRTLLPKSRVLVNNLAEAYRRQGRLKEAIALYDDIRSPGASEHQNLGMLYAEADSLDRALAHYAAALRMDPDRTEIVYSVAGIHLIQGRVQEAVRGYEAYLASPDPNLTLVRRSKHRLRQAYTAVAVARLDEGDEDGAIAALEKRVALGEMTADDAHTLALAYGRLGRFERAEQAAREAIALDPDLTLARLTLANALYEQKNPEAFTHYSAFVERWNGDPRLTRLAAERLRRR